LGVDRLSITPAQTRINSNVRILHGGSATSPALTVNGDTDTGIYAPGGDNTWAVSVGGARRLEVGTSIIAANIPYHTTSSGTSTTPVYSFQNDSDTGMYLSGTNALGFSTNTIRRLLVRDTSIECNVNTTVIGTLTANAQVVGNVGIRTLGNIEMVDANASIRVGGIGSTQTKFIYSDSADSLSPDGNLFMYNKWADVNTSVKLGLVWTYTNRPLETANPVSTTTAFSRVSIVNNDQLGEELDGTSMRRLIDFNNIGQAVFLQSGNVTAPTLALDTTSGWYRIGASNLGLTTNGVLRMSIDTSNISIGTGNLRTTSTYNVPSVNTTNTGLSVTSNELQICDSTGTITLTLPATGSSSGKQFKIININTGITTIIVNNIVSENFNGDSARVSFNLAQHDHVQLVCYGSVWYTF
jgi:hypothetical protein